MYLLYYYFVDLRDVKIVPIQNKYLLFYVTVCPIIELWRKILLLSFSNVDRKSVFRNLRVLPHVGISRIWAPDMQQIVGGSRGQYVSREVK